jgi:hypothetical protein
MAHRVSEDPRSGEIAVPIIEEISPKEARMKPAEYLLRR